VALGSLLEFLMAGYQEEMTIVIVVLYRHWLSG